MKGFRIKLIAIHIFLSVLIYQCLCVYIFPIMYDRNEYNNSQTINISDEKWDEEIAKLNNAKMLAYVSKPYVAGELYIVALYPNRTLVIMNGIKNESLIGLETTDPFSEIYYIKTTKVSLQRYYYLVDLAEQVRKEQKPSINISATAHIYARDFRYKGKRYLSYDGDCEAFDKIFEDIEYCNNIEFVK